MRKSSLFFSDILVLAARFVEDKAISVLREKSLINVSLDKYSPLDISQAGWILTDGDKSWMCPHCHVRYDHENFSDPPWRTHQQLSPRCLFILSPNPLGASQMPISSAGEHFNKSHLATFQHLPYDGLAERRDGPMSCISDRRQTFDTLGEDCSTTFDRLAMAGFFLIKPFNWIKCFYCARVVPTSNLQSMVDQLIQSPLHSSRCRFTQQLHDCRTIPATSQGNIIEHSRPALCISCRMTSSRFR